MVRYVPRLADGHRVELAWPLALFRLNHIFWPLDPSTGRWGRYLDRALAVLGCLIFLQHNDAELRYLRLEASNLNMDAFLTGMPTYLILVEAQFRSMHILLHFEELQQFLQRFYFTIYIDPRKEPDMFRRVDGTMLVNRMVSAMYGAVISGYLISPILSVINRRKDFLYSMIFPFNTEPLSIFIPLLLSNVWVGIIIDSMMFGETSLLCELIVHLNGRYLLLKRDLEESIQTILADRQRPHMARQLKELIIETLRKNVALNKFGEQLESQYTVRVFIMFAFAAGLLCALSFKAYTNPMANYIYAIWFGAKTVELLSLGELGSTLAYTTDSLSSMYYLTHWEQVLVHSTNTQENLRLLKLINLAIEMNSKPFYVTGLRYFRVSLQAGIKILQASFSYFTFLTSMQRRQMSN
ncbi:odorant receptor 35a [Drosophila guanche]|uniref:Odorant receptor n=1 Tax=Drosophila guanche TaxID=7266 RepID=A0A3B0K738_DROGU|nr:odorant receptor 35a [Drosophila guanche]SPP81839.1 blast:Odorant receptor 35a [Drosophila guanche]